MKKQPSKTDKVFYELMVQNQELQHRLMTNSAHLVAMGIELKISPEKMAEIMVKQQDKISEYAKAMNTAIDTFESERRGTDLPTGQAGAPVDAHAGHNHGPEVTHDTESAS